MCFGDVSAKILPPLGEGGERSEPDEGDGGIGPVPFVYVVEGSTSLEDPSPRPSPGGRGRKVTLPPLGEGGERSEPYEGEVVGDSNEDLAELTQLKPHGRPSARPSPGERGRKLTA